MTTLLPLIMEFSILNQDLRWRVFHTVSTALGLCKTPGYYNFMQENSCGKRNIHMPSDK